MSYTCECGNDSRSDGFSTCLPDGTEIEPTLDSPWVGHYVCEYCRKVEHVDVMLVSES
jgi:hypothetical protein